MFANRIRDFPSYCKTKEYFCVYQSPSTEVQHVCDAAIAVCLL